MSHGEEPAMSWRATIDSIPPIEGDGYRVRSECQAPASIEDIEAAETSLNCCFPESLRSLLLETDGVLSRMSVRNGEWFKENWFVWPVAEIVEQNQWLREHNPDRHLDRFIFFSSPGTDGNMFGFPAAVSPTTDASVFEWFADETEDAFVPDGLQRFLIDRISGVSLY